MAQVDCRVDFFRPDLALLDVSVENYPPTG
jgi:hypothetical protein